jgi:hypothetical protein
MNGNCLETFKTGEERFFSYPPSKCSVSHYPFPLSLLSFSLSLQHKSLHITSDDGDGLWNIGHQLHIGTAHCWRICNCMLMSWKREIIYNLSLCVSLPSNLPSKFSGQNFVHTSDLNATCLNHLIYFDLIITITFGNLSANYVPHYAVVNNLASWFLMCIMKCDCSYLIFRNTHGN